MGVHKYYGMFVSKVDGVIANDITNCFGLIMDLNGFAHRCCQAVFGYGKTLEGEEISPEMKQRINNKITKTGGFNELKMEFLLSIGPALTKIIIEQLKPTDFLIMALDGKAPLAKGKQQLSRRTAAGHQRGAQNFDTAYLTAGTPFMREISEKIKEWLVKNVDKLPNYTLFSDSDVEGEGEHKIFRDLEMVRQMMIKKYPNNDIDQIFRNQKIGVYGLDADLGILSTMRDYNFVWIREQVNINLVNRGVNINVLRDQIFRQMTSNIVDKSVITQDQKMNVISDFTVLSYLIGDDFVPAMFPFTLNIKMTLDKFMEVYSSLVQQTGFLTNEAEINIPVLTQIMTRLVEVEREMFEFRKTVQELEDSVQLDGILDQKVREYRVINGIRNDPNETYEHAEILENDYENFCRLWKIILRKPCLFSDFHNKNFHNLISFSGEDLDFNSDQACQDYITGLRWNFAYYKGHEVNNWFYKRSLPPTIHALAQFLQAGKYIMEPIHYQLGEKTITPSQMLVMTLNPHFSMNVIKSCFDNEYEVAISKCIFLKSNFPTEISYCSQGKYKSELHSKIPLIPQILFEEIMRIQPINKVDKHRFTKNDENFKNQLKGTQFVQGGYLSQIDFLIEKKKGKKGNVRISDTNEVKIIPRIDEITQKPKSSIPTNKLDDFLSSRRVSERGGRGSVEINLDVKSRRVESPKSGRGGGRFEQGRGGRGRFEQGRGRGRFQTDMKVHKQRPIRYYDPNQSINTEL